MHLRWATTISPPFLVSHGVKQGGILSPMLFSVFINEISIIFNQSVIWGDIGCHLIGHFCYSDDLFLVSLFSVGMLTLLGISSTSSTEHLFSIMNINHTRYVLN